MIVDIPKIKKPLVKAMEIDNKTLRERFGVGEEELKNILFDAYKRQAEKKGNDFSKVPKKLMEQKLIPAVEMFLQGMKVGDPEALTEKEKADSQRGKYLNANPNKEGRQRGGVNLQKKAIKKYLDSIA